jgi:hypothetical protein
MSSHNTAHSARVVPAQARTVAARLAALFDSDRQLAERLNAAQRRLRAANDQLSPEPALDPRWPACDRAAANRQPATAPDPALARGVGAGRLHWEIHGAFCAYQHACEQRRQLAFEVGELAQQLTDALICVGWSKHDAERADVHQLASSTQPAIRYPPSQR